MPAADVDFVGESEALSRTDFKASVTKLGMKLSADERGKLRKKMDPQKTKLICFGNFATFIDDASNHAGAGGSATGPYTALPPLPMNLPQLPEGFCRRPDLEDRIINLLCDTKTDILAQGMGVR
jgi:hypothetical protein